MSDYSIFTMCSKNYKDAYDFVIKSWLKSKAKYIYIYTDDPGWKSNNNRIIIINFFDKITDDWLVNTGRRVIIGKDIIKFNNNRLVFLDIDCYLLNDIGYVFDEYDFDFAVTRLHRKNIATSAGVYFFYNTEHNKRFFDDWFEKQNNNYKKRKGVVAYENSYAQRAFSDVLRKYYKEKTHVVIDLDVNKYNRKTGKPDQTNCTIEALKKNEVDILHFYARTWRDKKTVNKIFQYITV